MPVIYHGTPMTPRAALLDVCKGRAMCVSFFRPDDVEAVEAISPGIMFRQRRVFHVEGGATSRGRVGGEVGVVGLFRLARTAPFSSEQVGSHSRYAGSAKPAQRRATRSVAIWAEGIAALAHGRANRAALAAMRQVRPGLPRLDRRGQALGQAGISRPDARGRSGFGQQMAGAAHDARDQGRMGLSVRKCGWHNTSTERVAL